MRLFSKMLLVLLSVCLADDFSFGQDVDDETRSGYTGETIMGSLYLDMGIPLSTFADNISETGWGLGGEILVHVQKEGPVWAGIGVHSFEFDDYSVRYFDQGEFELIEYKERTASRQFGAYGILRFQPTVDFFVQPYVQGAFGIHWYFTNTKIEDVEFDEVVDRFKENQDSALGFALHAGFMYIIRSQPEVRIDTRIGYFRNAAVEYMRYNASLGGVGGYPIDYFEVKESPVEFLGLHIGMTAAF